MRSFSRFFLLILFSSFSLSVFAGIVRGKVTDSETGEPLVGATVTIEGASHPLTTLVRLDGSFIFKDLPAGTYTVKVSNIGYEQQPAVQINLTASSPDAIVNVPLKVKTTEMSEVTIATNHTGSDAGARSLEKKANTLQNILSEKTIQLLPDVTVANALQRMSGVTIQRNSSGEGRYAIIRGMQQRYNNTLVNGIKIPSPDDQYRFVPMDLFPSDMLQRLEVIKALTPDMEADAIGGTMNLVMKSAPDNFLFTANGALGTANLFSGSRPFKAFSHSVINKNSPAEINGNNYSATSADFPLGNLNYTNKNSPVNTTLGSTIGDRFLDKKLGVVLSVSYQNLFGGSNQNFLIPNAQPNPVPANQPVFTDAYARQNSNQTSRVGIHNKIDYRINGKNVISLYNMYVHQNDFQTRYTEDTTLVINSSSNSKLTTVDSRSRWQMQSIYNATLHGEHLLGKLFKLDWSAVYSIAKNRVPDMASYNFDENSQYDNTGKLIHVDSTIKSKSMKRIWQHNSDQDLAGYLNGTYVAKIFKRNVEFKAGGLYRHKTRDNYYNEYSLDPYPIGVTQTFHSVNTAQYGFSLPAYSQGNYTAETPNNYTATENVGAGYLQVKFLLCTKLQILGGARVEHTHYDYTTVMPDNFNGRSGTIFYTDVLPSIHVKYDLTPTQAFRASYFKSISRPGFGEYIPYDYPGDYFDQIGNPYLKHTQANNYDLRYELFPGRADQVLLGAFYKYIHNPIEYFVVRNGGPSAQFIQPANVDKAINFGFEAVVTKYIGKFGVSANYTYTHSEVTTNKLLYKYDSTLGNSQVNVSQKRPLQGQANHVGNLSLLYKDNKSGLDVQLAFVYTGERIAQVSPYYGLDFWDKPFSQLAFSMEKRLVKKFYFYAKVNNLTNSQRRVYLKYPSSQLKQLLPYQTDGNITLVQKDTYRLSFLAGIRYKF